MTEHVEETTEPFEDRRGWRLAALAAVALVLVAPLIAMPFTDEVNWTAADFAFAGALLLGVVAAYELALKRTGNRAYRSAVKVALAAAFLLLWITGAVGIIGSEANPANLMYAGVLAIAGIGALVARFRPRGMAWAMAAAAGAQALVAVLALGFGLGVTGPVQPWDVVFLTAGFAGLWLLAAWLFRSAARGAEGETLG